MHSLNARTKAGFVVFPVKYCGTLLLTTTARVPFPLTLPLLPPTPSLPLTHPVYCSGGKVMRESDIWRRRRSRRRRRRRRRTRRTRRIATLKTSELSYFNTFIHIFSYSES